MNRLVAGTVLLFGLWACDGGRVYEAYRQLDHKGWHPDSAVVFSVGVRDTLSRYRMFLGIRNRGDYANANLWLSLVIRFPDHRMHTDTAELILAGPSGKWEGRGIGDLFDSRFLYETGMEFPVSGTYRFEIRHSMRTGLLKGIHDVGLRLEKEPKPAQ
ncbi:MAG: gliding motility lipoprotein GldH [Mangrovibacterium sp.]